MLQHSFKALTVALPLIGGVMANPVHHPRPQPNGSAPAVPDYVVRFAPMVHLYSNEKWWPASVDTHLAHCTPIYNDNLIAGAPAMINSSNADFTPIDPSVVAANIYYTSNDNVEDDPEWLLSPIGKPDNIGKSGSPSIIVVVDKSDVLGPGIIDAYYFMFYSYNHGVKDTGNRYLNHVGDWECVTIRFQQGAPTTVYLSQSLNDGNTFSYDELEKVGQRPVVYAADGTHSLYPRAGTYDFEWSLNLAADHADAGPTWDLAANYNAFWYSAQDGFSRAKGTVQSPHFLEFLGHWGDRQYSKHDSRQYCDLFSKHYCHYVDGPLGPQTGYLLRLKL